MVSLCSILFKVSEPIDKVNSGHTYKKVLFNQVLKNFQTPMKERLEKVSKIKRDWQLSLAMIRLTDSFHRQMQYSSTVGANT